MSLVNSQRPTSKLPTTPNRQGPTPNNSQRPTWELGVGSGCRLVVGRWALARLRPSVVRHYTSKLMQGAESGVSATTAARAKEARAALDQWLREVVAWHFDPATGSPFWLERAKTLGWDPRERIQTFADLRHFGGFEDEWL